MGTFHAAYLSLNRAKLIFLAIEKSFVTQFQSWNHQ